MAKRQPPQKPQPAEESVSSDLDPSKLAEPQTSEDAATELIDSVEPDVPDEVATQTIENAAPEDIPTVIDEFPQAAYVEEVRAAAPSVDESVPAYSAPEGSLPPAPGDYYRAPNYVGNPAWAPPTAPIAPRPQPIPTAISVGAFGGILVIMALGLLFAMWSGYRGSEVMISAAGLCLLVVAGVLTYAALQGLRAGGFVAVSLVGALVMAPIVGMTATLAPRTTWESSASVALPSAYSSGYDEDTTFSRFSVSDSFLEQVQSITQGRGTNYYSAENRNLVLDGSSDPTLKVLDLTSARYLGGYDGLPWSIEIFSGQQLAVLIPKDADPHIYDDNSMGTDFIATRWDSPNQRDRDEAQGWIFPGQEGNLDYLDGLWQRAAQTPYNSIFINVHGQDSRVWFIQVGDESLTEPAKGTQAGGTAGTNQDPQSGPQSGGLSAKEAPEKESAEMEKKRSELEAAIAQKQAELDKLNKEASQDKK